MKLVWVVCSLDCRSRSVRRKMWPVYARAIEASVGQHLNIREVTCLDDILGKLIEKVGDT